MPTHYAKRIVTAIARLAGAGLLLASLLALWSSPVQAAGNDPGAVFVMSNSSGGNQVLVFSRATDGTLTSAGGYATGGLGTGAGLGSQGSLTLSEDGRWLFAVNAASNSVSVFAVGPSGLRLADTEPSGGALPIGVTAHQNLVYVLNAGGAGNIAGFTLGADGQLAALAGSIQPLSNGGVGPAQVEFSPDGRTLVVTEKATNRILTYSVGGDGVAAAPVAHPSAGATPFGFAFGLQGTLVVSEAFGGAANASAASSYDLRGGALQLVSASAPTHQTAACWVAVTGNGKFAYTTNAGSGSVSGYAVGRDGQLALLDASGQTALTGAGPTDLAVSHNSQFLYVVAGGAHQVAAFAVGSDGSLHSLGQAGLPAGAVGIAAW
jgi:6-phosphogluconolactonase (cycloisomerase 2 family)